MFDPQFRIRRHDKTAHGRFAQPHNLQHARPHVEVGKRGGRRNRQLPCALLHDVDTGVDSRAAGDDASHVLLAKNQGRPRLRRVREPRAADEFHAIHALRRTAEVDELLVRVRRAGLDAHDARLRTIRQNAGDGRADADRVVAGVRNDETPRVVPDEVRRIEVMESRTTRTRIEDEVAVALGPDTRLPIGRFGGKERLEDAGPVRAEVNRRVRDAVRVETVSAQHDVGARHLAEIGRASCRERV